MHLLRNAISPVKANVRKDEILELYQLISAHKVVHDHDSACKHPMHMPLSPL